MIKVLVVDDSAIVRAILGQVLGDDKRFEVCGFAENGEIAVELNEEHSPDLIIMDLNMPKMDGIEATRKIMETSSPAIIIYTTEDKARVSFECLEAGALLVQQKPNLATLSRSRIEVFCEQLAVIALEHAKQTGFSTKKPRPEKIFREVIIEDINTPPSQKFSLLAIGASTGGPIAIQTVLSRLAKNFPLPIIITQHIDSIFDCQFATWLSDSTGKNVKLAENSEILKAGTVYIAPAGRHLCITKNASGELKALLDDSEPLHYLKPAVDKMFFSCAQTLQKKCIAVLLTGMGTDGAEGLKAIKDAGGYTVTESSETCVIYGMPKAANDLNAQVKCCSLYEIPVILNHYSGAMLSSEGDED